MRRLTQLISKIFYKLHLIFAGKETKKEVFTNRMPSYTNFSVGDYTYGEPNILFANESTTLKIGKFCSIAKDVTIFLGGNHRTDWISTYPFFVIFDDFNEDEIIQGHPSTKGDVVIGNDVWIGRSVIILSGVSIGNGAVVAAGSVVSKNIGDYEIWGGNPAQLIKKRFDDFTIEKLNEIRWWDWDLKKIKKNVDAFCSNNKKKIIELNTNK